jgi:hypothetical protein
MSDNETLNVAENIMALLADNDPKPRRRRESTIEDGRLWQYRDCLVGLLETTWGHVGDKLPRIKKPADVYEALRVWEENHRDHLLYVTRALLRLSGSPATMKSLNQKRRQMRDLNVSAHNASAYLEKCCAFVDTAVRALNAPCPETERALIDEKLKERAIVAAHAANAHLALQKRQEDMVEHIKDCEAYFARSEFCRFCKSKRYRLTPKNTGDALAGVPEIGWRQSAKRCKKEPCVGLGGGSMQVFETIRRIVQSCARKPDLLRHAERWLRAQRRTKSFGTSELQTNWYYLRLAIKASLEASIRSRDLPFAITREYEKRRYHPSNPDVVFAEEERIVV